jgi:holo-[acyl-carrier protein] synthase
MILGLGTDSVEIQRLSKIYQKFGARFAKRLFTPLEQAYCEQYPPLKIGRYAKRFAAKEACLKALGTGRRGAISWQDIEVSNTTLGQPVLTLTGGALARARSLLSNSTGELRIHLSLSDTRDQAQAIVILEELHD